MKTYLLHWIPWGSCHWNTTRLREVYIQGIYNPPWIMAGITAEDCRDVIWVHRVSSIQWCPQGPWCQILSPIFGKDKKMSIEWPISGRSQSPFQLPSQTNGPREKVLETAQMGVGMRQWRMGLGQLKETRIIVLPAIPVGCSHVSYRILVPGSHAGWPRIKVESFLSMDSPPPIKLSSTSCELTPSPCF